MRTHAYISKTIDSMESIHLTVLGSSTTHLLCTLLVNLWSDLLAIMRVLALHGLGASGGLLKKQLAPFIRGLGASFQFIFLDGSIECGKGPGMLLPPC